MQSAFHGQSPYASKAVRVASSEHSITISWILQPALHFALVESREGDYGPLPQTHCV